MWREYNPNPNGARVGDCTIRALSKALDKNWGEVYSGLAIEGRLLGDMPSANHVWGSYLRKCRFTRNVIDNTCPACYTVRDFCRDHPDGTYVLAIDGHVVCVSGGDYFDSWDSGDCIPIYYWKMEE